MQTSAIFEGMTPKAISQMRHRARMDQKKLERAARRGEPADERTAGPNRFNYWHRHNDEAQTSRRRAYRNSPAGQYDKERREASYAAAVRAQKGFTTRQLEALLPPVGHGPTRGMDDRTAILVTERKRLDKNARSRASKAKARARAAEQK